MNNTKTPPTRLPKLLKEKRNNHLSLIDEKYKIINNYKPTATLWLILSVLMFKCLLSLA